MPRMLPMPRMRVPRIDPLGPLVTAAGLVIFLLHGFQGRLVRDIALFTYSAQQFADGVPPYVAVLNRSGPLAHMVPGFAVMIGRALGIDDLLAARISGMVASLAVLWLAYLLGRDLFRSKAAGAAVAASFTTFQIFVNYATWGPRDKTLMVLFIVAALWALLHQKWFLAGGAVALSTLSLQTGFFPAAAAVAVAVLLLPGLRAKAEALVRFVLGGIVVTAGFAIYFAAVGALHEFYECFYAIHATYTHQRGILKTLSLNPHALQRGYGWGYPVLVVGMVWTVVMAAWRLRRLDRSSPADLAVVGVAVGALTAAAWTLEAFQASPDALTFLPFAAVGAGGLAHAVVSRLPGRWPVRALAVAAAITLVAAGTTSYQTKSRRLVFQEKQVNRVFRLLGPDATVLSVGAPQPLVVRGLRNPIRDQMFLSGLDNYIEDTRPGGLAGVAARIEEIRPTLITVDEPRAYRRWLPPVLQCCYVSIGGSKENYFWFVTDTTDPNLVAKLSRAVARVPQAMGGDGVRRSMP